MPRMPLIAGVREAEPWNLANVLGGLFVLIVVVLLLVWIVRRYLSD